MGKLRAKLWRLRWQKYNSYVTVGAAQWDNGNGNTLDNVFKYLLITKSQITLSNLMYT
jgi:hypothetical protein